LALASIAKVTMANVTPASDSAKTWSFDELTGVWPLASAKSNRTIDAGAMRVASDAHTISGRV
jgi:hypothetical protein